MEGGPGEPGRISEGGPALMRFRSFSTCGRHHPRLAPRGVKLAAIPKGGDRTPVTGRGGGLRGAALWASLTASRWSGARPGQVSSTRTVSRELGTERWRRAGPGQTAPRRSTPALPWAIADE